MRSHGHLLSRQPGSPAKAVRRYTSACMLQSRPHNVTQGIDFFSLTFEFRTIYFA